MTILNEKVKNKSSSLGSFTVIGPNTRIGKNARIQSTVVYGQVEFGEGTEFREKLILGTTVITPGTEHKTLISDQSILRLL